MSVPELVATQSELVLLESMVDVANVQLFETRDDMLRMLIPVFEAGFHDDLAPSVWPDDRVGAAFLPNKINRCRELHRSMRKWLWQIVGPEQNAKSVEKELNETTWRRPCSADLLVTRAGLSCVPRYFESVILITLGLFLHRERGVAERVTFCHYSGCRRFISNLTIRGRPKLFCCEQHKKAHVTEEMSSVRKHREPPTRRELIVCPRCGAPQYALIIESTPFHVYSHECAQCDYQITHADWQKRKET